MSSYRPVLFYSKTQYPLYIARVLKSTLYYAGMIFVADVNNPYN